MSGDRTSRPDPGQIRIAYFDDRTDRHPKSTDGTWGDLVEGLREPRACSCALATCARGACAHKDGPAWSPAAYPEGATRSAAAVASVHALVVDLDRLDDGALATALASLAGYRYVVHASHSDRPGDRCARVVIELSRAVPGRDWYRFWRAAIAHLGLTEPADPACKDPSRIYYLPSRPADACHEADDGTGYMFAAHDGEDLDVDAILASAQDDAPRERLDFEVPEFRGSPSTEALEDAARILAEAWPKTGRHQAQLALSGALARAAWPVELIAEFVAAVCEIADPGNADLPKRLESARSSVAKVQAGESVAGWPTLETLVDDGASVVRRARELLGLAMSDDARSTFREAMASVAIRRETDPAIEPAPVVEPIRRWYFGDEVADVIRAEARTPTLSLRLDGQELIAVRPGGIVVLIGGTGAGKSSLASALCLEHAHHTGPALVVSLELPIAEISARAIGIAHGQRWLDVLEGRTEDLSLPRRLAYVERRHADMATVHELLGELRARHPDEPLLVAVDYVQLVSSTEREIRRRVADAMEQLDALAREHRAVVIALSQTSRQASRALRSGDALGADTTDTAAEAAEVERWASTTLAIGAAGDPDGDGCAEVPLSVGKARMGGGDRVIPMRYQGWSGRWRIAGEAQRASEARAEGQARKRQGEEAELDRRVLEVLRAAQAPMSRADLARRLGVRGSGVSLAVRRLLDRHEGDASHRVVEVLPPVGGSCPLWTESRATSARRRIQGEEVAPTTSASGDALRDAMHSLRRTSSGGTSS